MSQQIEEFVKIENIFRGYWINALLIPVLYDPVNIYNILIKNSRLLSENSKFVSADDNEDARENYKISYDRFKSFNEKNENYYFFIDNYEMVEFYALESMKKRRNVNYYIILLNLENIKKIYDTFFKKLTVKDDYTFFSLPSIDLKFDFQAIEEKKTEIFGKHLEQYKKKIVEYLDSKNIDPSSNQTLNYKREAKNILNIYFDKIITKTLTNLNLEDALNRAPKFRYLLLSILTQNKKRHLIRMIDGQYGINSFVTIFNKIESNMEMIIIRKSDKYEDRVKKLKNFNICNSPKIILTDYNFSGNSIPKNINYYHLFDGGRSEDLITFLACLKSKNYSGLYPRQFKIVSHYAITPNQAEETLDSNDFKNFKTEYDLNVEIYTKITQQAYNIIQKEGSFVVAT